MAGLSGAFNASVAGIGAQSRKIGSISENISNVNTVGFKSVDTTFSSQLSSASSIGGVTAAQKRSVGNQGLISNTGNTTDLAVSGGGFFVVNTSATAADGSYGYTRDGRFDKDSSGYLRNPAGFYLYGWKLDSEGRLPGEQGNINTTSAALLTSTTPIRIDDGAGTASPTTKVDFGLNLKADEEILEGSGSDAEIPTADTLNTNKPSTDIILPTAYAGIVTADTFTLTSGSGLTYTYNYGGFERSNDITGTILGAATVTAKFSGATDGDNFTITNGLGTFTFTYESVGANPNNGTFDSLESLASAINQQVGLTAKTDGTNFLYISSANANDALTFADVQGTFAAALGLANVAASTDRFNTIDGLSTLINASPGFRATVTDAASDAKMAINLVSPLDTITFSDAGTGSFLTEFGLSAGPFGPEYDSAGSTGGNMASGDINSQFSKNIRVIDSLGVGHDFRIGFIKVDELTWDVEVWAANNSDIVTSLPNGQIATGQILFNGDGSLRNVTSTLTNPIQIVWANDSAPGSVSLNFGTAGPIVGTIGATVVGLTDGISQFAGDYDSRFVKSNGAETGKLSGINIDENGFVVANYSNGQSLKVYKLPIATFPNPNGLEAKNGNLFVQTVDSGDYNLREAGSGSAGKVVSGAVEETDVDLAAELTDMIVAQRAYQGNTKVIKTIDDLLDQLNTI